MKKKLFSFLFMAAVAFAFGSCRNDHDIKVVSNTFILVHGAWQGPYVWLDVKQQLEAKGQKVIVVELPAHGDDFTSPAKVSINVYRDKVIEAMRGLNEKVILVGHSMGGVVVSAVAEKVPAQINKLVYIGAFLPANGQSLLDLALQDAQSQLGASLIPSADQLTLDINRENIVSIFCQDAPENIKKLVVDKFRIEPAIPFADKALLTDDHFGRVNKYYIHTLQDHAIGVDLQNKMVAVAHILNTYSLNTGHSPFLSRPDEVTNLLLEIGK